MPRSFHGVAGVVEKFGPFLSFDELLPILPDPPPTFDLVQACEACNIWRVEQKHVFLRFVSMHASCRECETFITDLKHA